MTTCPLAHGSVNTLYAKKAGIRESTRALEVPEFHQGRKLSANPAPRLLRAAMLLLLLVAAGRRAAGAPVVNELRCQCLQTLQGIHLKNIQSVKVTTPGPHCDQTEVIASLKTGQEVCLNPTAPMVKKIIDKMLNKWKSLNSNTVLLKVQLPAQFTNHWLLENRNVSVKGISVIARPGLCVNLNFRNILSGIKVHASRYDRFLKSIFYILLVVEAFSLQKVVLLAVQCAVRLRCGEESGPFC
nr:PREDICTED: uncharacterized protein LOC102271974 [Bos mutus]